MIAENYNTGGTGEEYPLSRRKGANTLEQKALQLGWNIPEDKRQEIVDRQIKIAIDADEDRYSSIAAKTLVSMNAQNVVLATSGLGEKLEITPEDVAEAIKEARSRMLSE